MDTTSSRVSGNIDRRQMAELPLQGRNWMELSLMVKGITANNIGNTPGVSDDQFQLNLDGQQISQRISGSGFGQPKMSREAIAEFQIVTNMYDITQGRSTGVQVQAVSRSGTNDLHGSTLRLLPQRQVQRSRPGQGRGAALLGSADGLHARRADGPRQGALLRVVRVRAEPVHRRADADGASESDAGRCRRTRSRTTTWLGSITSSRRRTTSASACSAGRSTARSRSRAARRIRRWPSTSATTRPTSTARGLASSATT